MNEQDLREIVNPVFNTAKSCVQLSAATGDKDAERLVDALGFDPFGSQTTKRAVPQEVREKVKKLFPAYMILIESRFQSVNRLIERRSDREIIDLPCGYTSRGIRLSRQGRTYFGCDLPAVIDAMNPAVESIIGSSKTITYHAVDATNYESLAAAVSDDSKNLLITTEGLLMYFAQSELEEVFSNIKRLLQKHGGSWVTTDRAYFLHDQVVVAASLNNNPELIGMYGAVTKNAAATAADVSFNDNVFFDPDDNEVKEFIGKMGFELQETSMADYLPEQIASVKGNPEADAAVREVFKNMMFWELTVAQDAEAKPIDANLPFEVESAVKDGVFEVSIQGRLDTITAPDLLKRFQDAQDSGIGIKAIHVDVSRMPYVSSAGLRVLLMMVKSLDNVNDFKMTGVTEDVQKILATTGIDHILLG